MEMIEMMKITWTTTLKMKIIMMIKILIIQKNIMIYRKILNKMKAYNLNDFNINKKFKIKANLIFLFF